MAHIGDFRLGDTFDCKFTTIDSTGAPITLAGTPAVSAYPGNSTTEITAGITLTVDFDTRTGLHNVRVVATSGNGYATATNYTLVITTGTVSGVSVVGYVIHSFSIENRSALMPTTAARTLDVSAGGEAGVDWANVGTPGSTVSLSATTVATVTTTTTATNVTTVNGLAANVITAASMNADASAEIADAVWDEDATGHQTQGTFGQAIGDPAADTNTIFKATVTDATGVTVGTDSSTLLTRLGTPSDLGGGATVAANLSDIEGQTDDIGVAGAGLTAVPWNAAWDAEVQSEVDDALVAQRLDELLNADSDIDGLTPPTVGSVFHELLTKSAAAFTYDQTTDSLEAIRDKETDIETHTAEIGAAGAGLTNINLPDQTMNITGDITGNLSGSVGSVTGAVGSVTGLTAANLDATISSRATPAQVNTEVVDALATDTYAEPAQGTPGATISLAAKLGFLYKAWRNKSDQTATLYQLYNDDAATVDHKATVSDDATTFTKNEVATGP